MLSGFSKKYAAATIVVHAEEEDVSLLQGEYLYFPPLFFFFHCCPGMRWSCIVVIAVAYGLAAAGAGVLQGCYEAPKGR